ncbi:phage holin family protein [Desulfovibrio piger]|uniref:phage holin family protein n=1 Tax=Desulfovibrio piger TaxID=901 RepID=UPI0026E9B6B9|nr:phage holin family protein [Desulfovibrio piger]
MNDINWLHAIHYYCDRLLELWPGKVALGTALAAVLTALGIDHVLFGVLLASVMGEMLTRIIVHCKRGKSLCRGLHHGLVRYSCYFFFLLMAVGVDISLRRALGFALPVTDVFMAYLVLTDCASIIGHLVWLGVPVPPLLVVLVTGGRTRLEKTVEEAVEGRRPRPPYRDDFAPPFHALTVATKEATDKDSNLLHGRTANESAVAIRKPAGADNGYRAEQPLDDIFMDTPQAPHREPRPCPPSRSGGSSRDDFLTPHTGGDGGHTDHGNGDGCGGGE